jgi:uncharacterized pyridoxamine 5'-phosphate oxidase family protein
MKTTIDLTQFDFNSRIFNQISDCPDTGFVRVLVFTGENFQERIKMWFINAEIVYINPANNKIVYTKMAKSKNEEWVISNNYFVTVLDLNGNPVPNPDFVTEITEPVLDELGNHQTQTISVPISETNLPYLTQGAFDRFSEFRVGTTYNLSMRQLWNMSVISDDAHGFFDEKENHKTLLETQLEIYN